MRYCRNHWIRLSRLITAEFEYFFSRSISTSKMLFSTLSDCNMATPGYAHEKPPCSVCSFYLS